MDGNHTRLLLDGVVVSGAFPVLAGVHRVIFESL